MATVGARRMLVTQRTVYRYVACRRPHDRGAFVFKGARVLCGLCPQRTAQHPRQDISASPPAGRRKRCRKALEGGDRRGWKPGSPEGTVLCLRHCTLSRASPWKRDAGGFEGVLDRSTGDPHFVHDFANSRILTCFSKLLANEESDPCSGGCSPCRTRHKDGFISKDVGDLLEVGAHLPLDVRPLGIELVLFGSSSCGKIGVFVGRAGCSLEGRGATASLVGAASGAAFGPTHSPLLRLQSCYRL